MTKKKTTTKKKDNNKKHTSPVKKKDKKAKDVDVKQELDILGLAKQEKDLSISEQKSQQRKGKSRKYTKEVFRLWMTLPDQFKGSPDRIVALLGVTDPILLELLKIDTMQRFAEEFGLHPPTLSRWRGDIEKDNDFAIDIKKGLRKITRNVLGAFYRKALSEGDAPRVKLWLQYVEDWREQLGIDHSGHVSNLDPEEKKALDRLIEKNRL